MKFHLLLVFMSLVLFSCAQIEKSRPALVIKKERKDDKARNLESLLNGKSKIGIIIDNSYSKEETELILKGIKSSTERIKDQMIGRFYIKRVSPDKLAIVNTLRSFINDSHVNVILSWGSYDFLKEVEALWPRYRRPTIFISKDRFENKNIYTVAPNSNNYGRKLVREMKRKGIKKVAVLTPFKYKNSEFLRNIKSYFKLYSIDIVYDEVYDPDDFRSMDYTCKKIFVINNSIRRTEYREIYNKEKLKASIEGLKLNRKQVFLPAKMEFDAIFIPDNFKVVKYFVNLFKFYKARNLTLIGTHEWRSPSLLASRDPMLEGAIFADFVGEYNSLPMIKASKNRKPQIFVGAKKGLAVDFGLMGFYAGLLSQISARVPYQNKKMNSFLQQLKLSDQFLGKRRAFTQNIFNWPTFLFEIRNNQLHLKSNL